METTEEYLPEILVGQKYKVNLGDGAVEEMKVIQIRAANITSSTEFIIAVTFSNDAQTFDENITNVIGSRDYELVL